MRYLVTGGTGFLGRFVARELERRGHSATFLTRKKTAANQIEADLTAWDAGLDISKIKGQYDILLHMAGLYNLRVSEDDAVLSNVVGTHTALTLAEKAEIPHFVHISTVAVTVPFPDKETPVLPSALWLGHRFPDHYASSKSNGEKLVRHWNGHFPTTKLILRPGILVGDSQTGAIERIDGPYHAIDAFRRLRSLLNSFPTALPLPGRHGARIPLVPVDAAARAIVELSERRLSESFHLAGRHGPTAKELFESALRHLDINQHVKIVDQIPSFIMKPLAEFASRLPREELEYILELPALDTGHTIETLGDNWCPAFSDYAQTMWRGYDAFIQNR